MNILLQFCAKIAELEGHCAEQMTLKKLVRNGITEKIKRRFMIEPFTFTIVILIALVGSIILLIEELNKEDTKPLTKEEEAHEAYIRR